MRKDNSKLVYSTDREVPRKKVDQEVKSGPPVRDVDQKVRVKLDRKGRGGKTVTVVTGLDLSPVRKTALLKELKTRLGTGGTFQDDAFEIQGDHCSAVIAFLEKAGFRPKRSGG